MSFLAGFKRSCANQTLEFLVVLSGFPRRIQCRSRANVQLADSQQGMNKNPNLPIHKLVPFRESPKKQFIPSTLVDFSYTRGARAKASAPAPEASPALEPKEETSGRSGRSRRRPKGFPVPFGGASLSPLSSCLHLFIERMISTCRLCCPRRFPKAHWMIFAIFQTGVGSSRTLTSISLIFQGPEKMVGLDAPLEPSSIKNVPSSAGPRRLRPGSRAGLQISP